MNEETRLVDIIRKSKDPEKAMEIAIKAILDFLKSSQSTERLRADALLEHGETMR